MEGGGKVGGGARGGGGGRPACDRVEGRERLSMEYGWRRIDDVTQRYHMESLLPPATPRDARQDGYRRICHDDP